MTLLFPERLDVGFDLRRRFLDTSAKLVGLALELFLGEGLVLLEPVVDVIDQRLQLLRLARVPRSEDLLRNSFQHAQWIFVRPRNSQ